MAYYIAARQELSTAIAMSGNLDWSSSC